jgi:hypothetical protein
MRDCVSLLWSQVAAQSFEKGETFFFLSLLSSSPVKQKIVVAFCFLFFSSFLNPVAFSSPHSAVAYFWLWRRQKIFLSFILRVNGWRFHYSGNCSRCFFFCFILFFLFWNGWDKNVFGYSFFFVENVTSTILTPTKRKLLKADHLHDELEEDEDLELPPPSPPRRYDYMTDPFTSCSRSESSTPLNSKMDLRSRDHAGIPLHHREFLFFSFFSLVSGESWIIKKKKRWNQRRTRWIAVEEAQSHRPASTANEDGEQSFPQEAIAQHQFLRTKRSRS